MDSRKIWDFCCRTLERRYVQTKRGVVMTNGRTLPISGALADWIGNAVFPQREPVDWTKCCGVPVQDKLNCSWPVLYH